MGRISKPLRDAVLRRDGYLCQICFEDRDRHTLTVDHVKPRAHGGSDTYANLRTAHKGCNEKRGHRVPHVGRRYL